MRKYSVAAFAVAGLLALGLSGCSDSESFDRDEAIDKLVEEGGMSEEQAECIVDAVEDEFGIEKLESDDELSEEDTVKLGEITIECMGGLDDVLDSDLLDDTATTVSE